MKISYVLAVALVLALAQDAHAQDAASLRAAIESHYAAIHAGDSETTLSHHLPDFSIFPGDGRILLEPGFFEGAERQGATIEWPTLNLAISHFNAQIYDDVGVAMFYLSGTKSVRGEVTAGTWRVSAVWRWQDGGWKEAHHHESPLIGRRHR
jgi:ketosteroid isomerase-like protein